MDDFKIETDEEKNSPEKTHKSDWVEDPNENNNISSPKYPSRSAQTSIPKPIPTSPEAGSIGKWHPHGRDKKNNFASLTLEEPPPTSSTGSLRPGSYYYDDPDSPGFTPKHPKKKKSNPIKSLGKAINNTANLIGFPLRDPDRNMGMDGLGGKY